VGMVLTIMGMALVLGLTVKRVGLEVYVTLFVFSCAVSLAFLFMYFRL
jgi:hypothetical protein